MIADAIFGGIISKVINDYADISKVKIKSVVESEGTRNQTLESQIYNVTVDALKAFAGDRKENNQDEIYEAAENLLKGFFGDGSEKAEVMMSSLRHISSGIDDEKCMQFKEILFRELSKNKYSELYREIRLLHEEKESSKTSRIEQNVNEIKEIVHKVNLPQNEKERGETAKLEKFIHEVELNLKIFQQLIAEETKTEERKDQAIRFQNNKKEDYIKNWNNRMFLHQNNDERPLTLADAFIMPDYELYKNAYKIEYWFENLYGIIKSFISHNKSSTMLITGEPGIGKSSVISWIANKYQKEDRVIILRFRDWEYEELQKGLLKAIFLTLHCDKGDLENKVLIIDGFDEIKSVGSKDSILDDFFNDILDYKNFKVIITSRPDYIRKKLFRNIVSLLPFGISKISEFYKIITGNRLDVSKINDINIIGIPVILYMSIMSNIDITENATRPELYNRIFAEEGGIFDRFSYEGDGYDVGSHPLRNKENIMIYLHFLRSLAFKMFEQNELTLRRGSLQIPDLRFQGGYISVLEFPIKHLFENTGSSIEFIHKSIYEYFAAEYIIEALYENINKDKEHFAGVLGNLFKENKLTKEIIEFAKYKIRINSLLHDSFGVVYDAFHLMLENGMTFYTDKHKKIIGYEMKLFANMLEVLHFWDGIHLELNDMMCNYIEYNRNNFLNLSSCSVGENNVADLKGVYLENAKLNDSNLQGMDFSGSNLRGADFRGSNLKGADFSGSNLKGASFINVDLSGADLRRTNLSEATFKSSLLVGVKLQKAELAKTELFEVDFRETDFKGVDIDGANLNGGILDEDQILYLRENKYSLLGLDVYMKESKEIISYEKYCVRSVKNSVQNLLKKD